MFQRIHFPTEDCPQVHPKRDRRRHACSVSQVSFPNGVKCCLQVPMSLDSDKLLFKKNCTCYLMHSVRAERVRELTQGTASLRSVLATTIAGHSPFNTGHSSFLKRLHAPRSSPGDPGIKVPGLCDVAPTHCSDLTFSPYFYHIMLLHVLPECPRLFLCTLSPPTQMFPQTLFKF